LACRLKLSSYIAVAFSAPLNAKRRVGRSKKTATCLRRQPTDLQEGYQLVELCSDDDEPDEPELDSSDDDVPLSLQTQQKIPEKVEPEPVRSRGRPKKSTQITSNKATKRGVFV